MQLSRENDARCLCNLHRNLAAVVVHTFIIWPAKSFGYRNSNGSYLERLMRAQDVSKLSLLCGASRNIFREKIRKNYEGNSNFRWQVNLRQRIINFVFLKNTRLT